LRRRLRQIINVNRLHSVVTLPEYSHEREMSKGPGDVVYKDILLPE
jgi:hypothetical protein